MIFEQYYLGCLSHASYLIGDDTSGRAVVVDPERDVTLYVADAAKAGLTIERVIETHVHADFVSGHLELAAATGATIWYGEGATAAFPIGHLYDGEDIALGDVVLEVRATPGHTPESISVVVYEHAGDETPYGVLTGDTLFIGDVGRPDLLSAQGATAEDMARQLHDSLQTKLLTLPDETRVFPSHGAGSACGKHLSSETSSTIGAQRATNYALAPMGVDDFIRVVTEGQTAAPAYFRFDAERNREERDLLDPDAPLAALTIDEAVALRDHGGVLLDTRAPADFAAGHLQGSVNVGLEGRFAEYAGDVIRPGQSIALIVDAGQEREARNRLARIGYDSVAGYIPLALTTSPELIGGASRLTASTLADLLAHDDTLITLVDVRGPGEVAAGAIEGSVAIPLAELVGRVGELDPRRPTVVYCASGYRSSVAASWLRVAGFADVSDLLGGYTAWSARS